MRSVRIPLLFILALFCGAAISGEPEKPASSAAEQAKKELLRKLVDSRKKPADAPGAADAVPSGPAPGELRPVKTGAAPTPERIASFDVDLTVNPDATVTVVERIQVAVQGNQIKKGIVRIIPIDHRTDGGGTHRTEIRLVSTTLDGKPVPNAVQRSGGNFSLVLGDVDVTLTHGIHTYEIRYVASGHIRFLKDKDALYYNVTGNFWELDIDEASFRAHLPAGAKVVATNAYTGKMDATGADFTKDGDLFFLTTRPLARGEGLTVAVDWSKGFVKEPPAPAAPPPPPPPPPREPPSDWEKWVDENRSLSLWGFAAVVLGYFGPAWLIFGKRRPQGTVMPLFYPPKDMDPGEAAALKSGKATPECFGADVMQLAVKRHVKVASFLSGFTLVETEPPPEMGEEGKLTPGLSMLKRNLFSGGTQNDAGQVTVNTSRDRSIVAEAYDHLHARYKDYAEYMLDRNHGISILGIALFGVYALAVFSARHYFAVTERASALENAATGGIMFVVGGGVGFLNYLLLREGAVRTDKGVFRTVGGGIAFFFGLFMLLDCFEGEYLLAVLLGAAAIAVFYLRLMPRRTREGEEKLTEIEGLEMYIKAAEEDRLAIVNAPEDTVEQYERLLPYAIALNCADAWEKRFASVLTRANYRPVWAGDGTPTGRAFYSRSLGRDAESASRAAAAAIREAQIASRSASKSGGGWWSGGSGSSGGRSGGGSGGGGGGGW